MDSLDCIKRLLDDDRTASGFFYTNDLKALTDILIQNLENSGPALLVKKNLSTLKSLIISSDYIRLKHRQADILDIVNLLAADELYESLALNIKEHLN